MVLEGKVISPPTAENPRMLLSILVTLEVAVLPRVGATWLGPLITKYLSLLNSHQCGGYLTNAPGVNLLLVSLATW